jgi:hypothetical protein
MYRGICRMKVVILGDGLLGSNIHQIMGWDVISRKQDGFDITQPELFINTL